MYWLFSCDALREIHDTTDEEVKGCQGCMHRVSLTDAADFFGNDDSVQVVLPYFFESRGCHPEAPGDYTVRLYLLSSAAMLY